MRDDEEGYCACEWQEQPNGTVETSCGIRIREHEKFDRCPKCKGSIVFLDNEDYDDDGPYWDDDDDDSDAPALPGEGRA